MTRYDPSNIFARILRGEIPNKTVVETAHTLAFNDIHPAAPTHILVIPKSAHVTMDDFLSNGGAEEVADFLKVLSDLCKALPAGYRVISNAGSDGMQEVPHFHMHVLAGRPLGPLLVR